jgi:hypothetical protein
VSGRTRADIALVAVVGDVEIELFDAFLEHYAALGVDELVLGFVRGRASDALIRRCEARACRPYIVHPGPWRVATSAWMHDELRRRARCDWHVLADVDEFQAYPGTLRAAVDECESSHRSCAAGLLLDRLAASSRACTVPQTRSALDRACPHGAFLTACVLGADARKVTLARRDISVAVGSHHLGDDRDFAGAVPYPVHHFKWRAGAREQLERRAARFADSTSVYERAIHTEALRAVAFLSERPSARKAIVDHFPASLYDWPPDWERRAEGVWSRWR